MKKLGRMGDGKWGSQANGIVPLKKPDDLAVNKFSHGVEKIFGCLLLKD
jgi:hypothetical protein